jgi:anti-sigma factor RsiW
MSELGPKLSAYIDGELPPDEMAAIKARLDAEPALQAELQLLRQANDAGVMDFAALLQDPVPLSLVRGISQTKPGTGAAVPPPRGLPVWASIAAGLFLFAVGGTGGYFLSSPDPSRDWVAELTEYHTVYAAQVRHLVEVPASEADHIQKWLGTEVGVQATIPDLTAQGLTFEGGRLLVAAGKPVGQLMYRDAAGTVVALCFSASDSPPGADAEKRTLNGLDTIIWNATGARYILIAPQGYAPLADVASAVLSI